MVQGEGLDLSAHRGILLRRSIIPALTLTTVLVSHNNLDISLRYLCVAAGSRSQLKMLP